MKVSFAAQEDSGPTVFLDQGGIRIQGECSSGGQASIEYRGTADNGDLYLSLHFADGTTDQVAGNNWDEGFFAKYFTNSGSRIITQTTVTYRGANGTTVTGDLLQAEGAGAAQCRIGGTLFVG